MVAVFNTCIFQYDYVFKKLAKEYAFIDRQFEKGLKQMNGAAQ